MSKTTYDESQSIEDISYLVDIHNNRTGCVYLCYK